MVSKAMRADRGAMFVLSAALALVFAAMAGLDGVSARDRGVSSNPVLRIETREELPVSRRLTLGLNKALLVELPVDVQDIIVSSPAIVDASVMTPRRVLLTAKTSGEANAFFLGRDGRKLMLLDLTVKRDLGDLDDMLKRLLPGSKIAVAASGDGVVLSGRVANPADASRAEDMAKQFLKNATVVNLVTAGDKEQVLLKVTVSEMQRDAIKRLGVNLPRSITSAGAFTFAQVVANTFPASAIVTPGAVFTGPGTIPAVQGGTAVQATANWNGNSVTGLIDMLERTGLSRTLAAPTLTAISGETAKFLAGGEFPVPINTQNNTVTVTWKQFGVSIAFTPYVLSEGRINLKLAAEVSELSSSGAVVYQGASIPAVQVRRAETSVEMASGAALAIAGLLSDQTRQNVDGVPELLHLPVLGSLFRSKDYRANSSELIILVTPYIARPTDPQSFARPDKGFSPATDLKSFFLGHLNRIYPERARRAAELAHGDYGFIVEYPEYGGYK